MHGKRRSRSLCALQSTVKGNKVKLIFTLTYNSANGHSGNACQSRPVDRHGLCSTVLNTHY